jgi:hypothetical protein
VAPNVVPRQSAVGQVANLRADCQSALGRVDNPPQDAILPHKRYVLDFLNNGITSNPASTAQIAAPSHARFIMARLVVCSASQICHASGKRALPANASRTPRNEKRKIVFTTPAERVRASKALKVPTAAQAARLHTRMAANSWPGGAINDPCQ